MKPALNRHLFCLYRLNLNLKPIFVYDESVFQKFDFYFFSTQPLMRKCKFSTIHKYKYEYFIIWNYDQQV